MLVLRLLHLPSPRFRYATREGETASPSRRSLAPAPLLVQEKEGPDAHNVEASKAGVASTLTANFFIEQAYPDFRIFLGRATLTRTS